MFEVFEALNKLMKLAPAAPAVVSAADLIKFAGDGSVEASIIRDSRVQSVRITDRQYTLDFGRAGSFKLDSIDGNRTRADWTIDLTLKHERTVTLDYERSDTEISFKNIRGMSSQLNISGAKAPRIKLPSGEVMECRLTSLPDGKTRVRSVVSKKVFGMRVPLPPVSVTIGKDGSVSIP